MVRNHRRSSGRYRRREDVSTRGTALISTLPLAVTRLNAAAADVIATLETETFERPADVAARAGVDPEAAARLLDQLHRRGFLEWAPGRDESFAPPVSVVVTVRNDRDHLLDCLDALEALEYPEYEVVVVDDGSTDGTLEAARAHRLAEGWLRIVSVGSPAEPLGIGASRNRGVDAARHDIVAFTDADCRPRPNWLSALVPCLAEHDVVGGRVRPHGTDTVDAYEGINSSLDMGESASRVDPDGATPYLPTANLLARRSVLERVPFPERNVAEDVDVCWRAIEQGYDVVYAADGIVEHDYRDEVRAFARRRGDYGGSEALLARTYQYGERVSLPCEPILAVITILTMLVGSWKRPSPLVTATFGALAVIGSSVPIVRGYQRLRTMITLETVLRSRGREAISRLYAVSKEVTRYYSGPLALIAFVFLVAEQPTMAVASFAAVVGVVVFPALVEYTVKRPSISPMMYAKLYLADHLGYQCGVYRGAIVHRTLAHLSPLNRFRVTGPLAAATTTLAAPIVAALSSETDVRTISVGGVRVRFRVHSTTESWWFNDETLRGERSMLADLISRLESDDVVLDVGANVGLYSCIAGSTLEDGHVIAVEPHPTNASTLAANLERNGIDAHVVRQALSSTNGIELFEVLEDRAGVGTSALVSGSANAEAEANCDRIDVEVTAGDTLVERADLPTPTVVKIDVEGAELDVLHGLDGTLSKPECRLVYCEIHSTALETFGGSPTDVEGFLRERGFVLEHIREWGDRCHLRAIRPVERYDGSTDDGVASYRRGIEEVTEK
ncbi:mycofactocin biosynthesis glycosyltransferase MftF [Natrialbaceae archaeon GCM10025810]|uniref:mycofactocin biosynthesis glycosyltransferase MftF n=1 Tax=Halovalidus salilacus TaxID=3075124 RepID=UPI00361A4790